uniref:Uncharacterized protein n=1 Tax=Lactuca sativa TaxID=4236 RepID=A0A9R1W6V0_LACSA|nr:hypothetical protein LSAT_V11C300111910 [Lactuca sativa]
MFLNAYIVGLFFVDVVGEVYDPEFNSWVDMPVGMGEGWPMKQTGTELSVIVDNDLYALDPSSSLESARIKVYDHVEDSWKVVEGDVLIRVAEIEIMIAEPKRPVQFQETKHKRARILFGVQW